MPRIDPSSNRYETKTAIKRTNQKKKKSRVFTKHREGWKDAIEKAVCNGWWHRSFGYGTRAYGCRPYPTFCNDDARHVKQRFRFRLSFSKVLLHRVVTRGKSCYFDGWNNILRDILSWILSSFHKIRIKIFPFFLPILCYLRGSTIRFIVPNFSKSFYENARETGWFIHLKAVLIEKNFAFGLYSD